MAPRTPFNLEGRRALITGSNRGIGLALARGLAEHGAEVIVNGRREEPLIEAVAALRSDGLLASHCRFDVTKADEVTRSIAQLEVKAPIDILVNNAGTQYRMSLEAFPDDKWEMLMKTNVTSAFLVAKAVAKGMIARRRGRIVNIASVQSELARPTIAPYAASKGAIRNLTRGMAADWARYGLQINAIAPGYFKTSLNRDLIADPDFSSWLEDRTPAGRWGEVAELTGAVVFLASDAASFVNGQTLYVDGGLTATV